MLFTHTHPHPSSSPLPHHILNSTHMQNKNPYYPYTNSYSKQSPPKLNFSSFVPPEIPPPNQSHSPTFAPSPPTLPTRVSSLLTKPTSISAQLTQPHHLLPNLIMLWFSKRFPKPSASQESDAVLQLDQPMSFN